MGKRNGNQVDNKKDTYSLKIIMSVLMLLLIVLGEAYVMINNPTEYILLIILTIVGLADVYVLMASAIQQNYKKELEHMEQYDSLFKSEKASYLILRKSFEEIGERLDRLEDACVIPTDEIIGAQKSIAKVSISRNKENTDALMNSNDKMVDKMFSLEDSLEGKNQSMLDKQRDFIESANKDMLIKQQEILSNMREMELSIKNEILAAVNQMNRTVPQAFVNAQADPVLAGRINEPQQEEALFAEDTTAETAAVEDVAVPDAAEAIDLEETANAEEAADSEEKTDPMEMFAKSLASQENDLESDSFPDDDLPDLDALFNEDDKLESLSQEEPSAEPVIEPLAEPPVQKPIADSNRMMTPDEIAALIAGTNEVEEPIIEEEVIEESSEPEAEEEKPLMPDMSDPNHKMTPDEIAALFANM